MIAAGTAETQDIVNTLLGSQMVGILISHFFLIHQAQANRWLLVWDMVPVRPSVCPSRKQSHAKTKKHATWDLVGH